MAISGRWRVLSGWHLQMDKVKESVMMSVRQKHESIKQCFCVMINSPVGCSKRMIDVVMEKQFHCSSLLCAHFQQMENAQWLAPAGE